MFAVHHRQSDQLAFFDNDPRLEGCTFPVLESVTLEGYREGVLWENGDSPAEIYAGQSSENPSLYRCFGTRKECENAGFSLVEGNPVRYPSWQDFLESLG